jgi:hypothetical protein
MSRAAQEWKKKIRSDEEADRKMVPIVIYKEKETQYRVPV